VQTHIDHALGFAAVVDGLGLLPRAPLDLGSGGGVPGLVLAEWWPEAEFVFLDSSRRRTQFLREAVDALGWANRARVVAERAEVAGRDPSLRTGRDVVVSRAFGPPAVTAECGSPLLAVGGVLVVSEPPGEAGPDGAVRWPPSGLSELGMEVLEARREPFAYQTLLQSGPCPDRFPRRTGVPVKRPLFGS
jgi:16S rRNA (guanine527-N7)-methyltransferase